MFDRVLNTLFFKKICLLRSFTLVASQIKNKINNITEENNIINSSIAPTGTQKGARYLSYYLHLGLPQFF